MRLISVELENLKSYAEPTVIELETGVNALVGHNGAGKSTVLEAIGAALFGYLPYKHEDFVRRGAATGRITVVLDSTLDERRYHVVRNVGKNPSWYVYDPELDERVAEMDKTVSRWLVDHMVLLPGAQAPRQYLEALFIDSVGPPQGTFTAPFLDAPSDKKSKFDRLLRIAEYAEAWNRLKDVRTELVRRDSEIGVRLGELRGQTERLPDVRAELHAKQVETDALSTEAQALALARADVDLQVERLERALKTRDEARVSHDTQRTAVETATERVEQAAAELARSQEAAEVVAQTRADATLHQNALARVGEQEERARQREELRGREQQAREQVQRCEGALAVARSRLADAEQDEAQLRELTPLIAEQRGAEEARERASTLVSDLEAVARALDELRQDLQDADDRRKEAAVDLRDRRQARQEADRLAPLQQELEELLASLGDLKNRADQLRTAQEAREGAATEVERFARQESEVATELARLDAVRPLAATLLDREASLVELGGRYHAAELALAKLRETRAQVEGGLCPFFVEPCLNVAEKGEGLTLEGFFDAQLISAETSLTLAQRMQAEARSMLDEATQADRSLRTEDSVRERLTFAARERARFEAERDRHVALIRELSDAPERLREAELHVTELQEALPALRDAAMRAGGLEAAQGAFREADRQLSQTRSRLERSQTDVERLPAAQQELAAARKRVEQVGDARGQAEALRPRAEQATRLRQEVARLLGESETLVEALSTVSSALGPYSDVDVLLGASQAERDRTREPYERFIASQDLAGALQARRESHARLRGELDRQASLLERAAVALAAAEAAYDPDRHDAIRQEQQRLVGQLASVETRLQRSRQEVDELGVEIDRLEVLERERLDRETELAELKDVQALAERMRGHVKAAGPRIAQTMLQRISSVATGLFGDVMGDASGQLEWRADYEVVLRQRGQERVFKQLSGGEQMSAALAIRLALLHVFSELNVAFLDEPTTNMDETRRANLARQLEGLRGFDQMLIISHDDAFDALPGHVYRVSKVDGASQVEAAV